MFHLSNITIRTAVVIWFAAAVLIGASRIYLSLPIPLLQITIVVLVAILLWLTFGAGWLATAALEGDIRRLVSIHLSRFVGFYFLYLYNRGLLPYDFAVLGGVGDIIVATFALLMLLLVKPLHPRRGAFYLAWNSLGLVDILFVVATAARLGLADRASMEALMALPLSLLPTFIVPLIIWSHIVIFVRLKRRQY